MAADGARSGPGAAGTPPGGFDRDFRASLTSRPAARLRPAQLSQIVRATVLAEDSWRPVLRFAERRWFSRLVLTDDYEIWLLSWLPGQHTGFHDHGEACGAFGVAQGELRETLAAPGRARLRHRAAGPGSVTRFGRQHVHDVANVAAAPAVSVHAYSPPLTAMRRYQMRPSGLALAGTDVAEQDW